MPDPQLRRAVLGSGMLAAAGGIAAIMTLPIAWQWQVLAGLGWCGMSGRDLWLISRANKACDRLRIDEDGVVHVFDRNNCCSAATIESGSVVLRRVAWLRFRTDTGSRHVELIRRNTRKNNEWRRLQVIWRHLGARG
ncbi:MAG: hypothetical protein GTO71_00915 [Woeseiaceae bacterium]|nr:hypothetical protein [Woeseiaceae bacterium]NIP19680.1 hypothetical protein [Woeseiaceae bacterium]